MSRYQIWNGTDTIYTYGPPYKFAPEEWLEQYPWADFAPCVIAGDDSPINGALCMPLADMISSATREGCDFSECATDAEKLAKLEAFEDANAARVRAEEAEHRANKSVNENLTAMSLASIAASMEYQNMMTLPDDEEVGS